MVNFGHNLFNGDELSPRLRLTQKTRFQKNKTRLVCCKDTELFYNYFYVLTCITLISGMYVTSFSVFYTEATVSIGLKNVLRMVTSILQN